MECEHCKAQFEPKQKYCTEACRFKASYTRKRGIDNDIVTSKTKAFQEKKVPLKKKGLVWCTKHNSWTTTCGC